MPTGVVFTRASASGCRSGRFSYWISPVRETTTISRAPSCLAAAWAVRDAPPLPKMTVFFPARDMSARRSM